MSKYTKTRIMDAFLYLLNEKSMDRLTVKDVIETAEVNRNTFYYHFEDIYDLLHQVLKRKLDDFSNDTEKYDTFYEEYVRSAKFLMNNKKAMAHIYHSKDRELLQMYMERITFIFVERFVREAAESYDISEEGIDYLTEFYSYTIVGNTMHWIQEGMPPYRERYLYLVTLIPAASAVPGFSPIARRFRPNLVLNRKTESSTAAIIQRYVINP